MKNFCIIGVAGFVAKKHINCIKSLKGNLVAACDRHDNVGFIDKDFPEAKFFNNEKLFFSFIKNQKIDYLIICTPSNLHFKHIQKGLEVGVDVIVEKPPLLSYTQYKKIILIEKKIKKKCYCIFQLRGHKKLNILKSKIDKSKKINNVNISYTTYRGNWYFKTWKNKVNKSGGLGINIGIHFFDILLWIFGDIKDFRLIKKTSSKMTGEIKLEKANVKWLLSIEKVIKKNISSYKFERYMQVNKKKYNFDKFNDLHKKNYQMIIQEKKFHISTFEKVIKLMSKLKK